MVVAVFDLGQIARQRATVESRELRQPRDVGVDVGMLGDDKGGVLVTIVAEMADHDAQGRKLDRDFVDGVEVAVFKMGPARLRWTGMDKKRHVEIARDLPHGETSRIVGAKAAVDRPEL